MAHRLTPTIPWPSRYAAEAARYKGLARGRRVYLLGTGPSISRLEGVDLSGELKVSVNHFGIHPRIDEIRPDFHLVADPAAFDPVEKPKFHEETVANIQFAARTGTRLVLPWKWSGLVKDTAAFKALDPFYYEFGGDPSLPIDFSRPVPEWGQNILNIALMWCLHLEASEVVMLGFDNGGVVSRYGQTPHFYGQREIQTAIQSILPEEDLLRCMYRHLQQLHQISRQASRQGMLVLQGSPEASFRMFPIIPFQDLVRHRAPTTTASASAGALARTVHGRILESLDNRADSTAVRIFQDGLWEERDGRSIADRIRRWRKTFSVRCRPGELVLFVKKLDVDLIAAYVGAMAAGCLPAQVSPFTPKTTREEYERKLSHLVDVTGAAHCFVDEYVPSLGAIQSCIRPSEIADLPPEEDSSESREECLAQFSSGTTGLQKAVCLRHEGVVRHMERYARSLELGPADGVISWLPLYHDMGLIAGFLMPLMEGIPLSIMDPFDWIANPSLLADAVEKFRPTVCFLPNFSYHVLARRCPGRDLSALRLLVNCSEPARPETHKIFLEAFPSVSPSKLSVCWAMAENTFAVSQTKPGTVPRSIRIAGKQLLSCGSVVEGTEVVVSAPDTDGIGELAIRGETLFGRFLDGRTALVDGFYPTGDLGAVVDGEVYVAGRKKDLVIVRGRNIHPHDVEFAANSVPGVHPGRVVCFGIPDEIGGSEDLVVLAELEEDGNRESILRAIAAKIEDETGTLPAKVLAVPSGSLIKTSSGKLGRDRNRELYLQGRFGAETC
ncbi:MAG TPA: AMP-binding protein [Fibrobacteria bacterium]|nr:AMP-binding protein [Fibrobacteria bacterium]